MALNDIVVPKENASGKYDEVVLQSEILAFDQINSDIFANKEDSASAYFFDGKLNVSGVTEVRLETPLNFNSEQNRTTTRSNLGLGLSATKNTPTTGNASSSEVVLGSDTRLSDARTPTAHTHGNLTNAGAIGTTANLPLRTGSGGVVEAGSFGTSAGTFCEGNDARLSDARTPTAHKSSHSTGGTDALAPSDIGAQSLFTSSSITSATTLSAGRARIFDVSNFGSAYNIILPLTNSQNGDIVVFRATNLIAASVSIIYEPSGSLPVTIGTITAVGQQYRFIYRAGPQDWTPVAVDTHTHVVADVTGAAASGSITTSGLTQATARILGRTSSSTGAIEEIQIGSGLSLSAGELSATGSGITAVGASTADVLSVSGSDLVADDPNADRIVFYDDSEGKWRYLEAGSGLSISGTTMTVTATGGATNLWIPASAWIPRTTSGCGVDSVEIGATNRQNLDQLLFDTGSEEFAQALVVMPSNYNNSTITARFYWTASSGSGGVAWGISGRAFGDDDPIDAATGTRIVVTDTLLASNDVHVTAATSAVTIDGTPAANKAINFQISRVVADAADTLAVDARLLGVEILFN